MRKGNNWNAGRKEENARVNESVIKYLNSADFPILKLA